MFTTIAEALVVVALALWTVYSTLKVIGGPNGAKGFDNYIVNFFTSALSVAVKLITSTEAQLTPIATAILGAFTSSGPGIASQFRAPIAGFVKNEFTLIEQALTGSGQSTPANATQLAADAMAEAFGFGASSAAVTALFEAAFPEKLNTLNGVGPIIAKMAGFDEVAAAVRDPLYHNAFGKSLDYHYRSLFKPELPDEADAVQWHSRGLLTDAQLKTIFDFSGLKAEYEPAFITSAYRAVSAFIGLRLLESGQLSVADATDLLQFNGYRPVDIQRLIDYGNWAAAKPYLDQYITAAERSTELGVMTPQELDQELTTLGLVAAQKDLIQLTIATRKEEQLAQLYRKSISEAYKYGTITDAQYVPSLEAIGIGAADAQAHYAVDSIAKAGKAAVAALRAAERLASQQMRAAGKAAVQGYRSGTLDAVALEAALLAAGFDPLVASFSVAIEALKREGNEVFIYGVTLPRAAALKLREQVTALGVQVHAKLVSPAEALTALAGYGVPQANAQALVADWAATTTAPSRVGVLLPR